jgi:hypothetical protein
VKSSVTLLNCEAGRCRSSDTRHPPRGEGRLGSDRSFSFRGPDNALNLRAYNLTMLTGMAEGVDDRPHRRLGDYSRWFREAIKDEDFAREAAEVELDTPPRREREPGPYHPGHFTTLHSACL